MKIDKITGSVQNCIACQIAYDSIYIFVYISNQGLMFSIIFVKILNSNILDN